MYHKNEFIILIILNTLDVLSTIYFLEFNIGREANPLGVYLLEKFGYPGLVYMKFISLGFLGFLLTGEDAKDSKIAKYSVWFSIFAYVLVVSWNIGFILSYYTI